MMREITSSRSDDVATGVLLVSVFSVDVAFELMIFLLSLRSECVRAMVNAAAAYGFGAPSTIDFISVSPLSNCPPIILSMFMNRWMALAMKFLSPDMLQVTTV